MNKFDKIIREIEKSVEAEGFKFPTLSIVDDVILTFYPKLLEERKKSEILYRCCRAVIIEELSNSYEDKNQNLKYLLELIMKRIIEECIKGLK